MGETKHFTPLLALQRPVLESGGVMLMYGGSSMNVICQGKEEMGNCLFVIIIIIIIIKRELQRLSISPKIPTPHNQLSEGSNLDHCRRQREGAQI